LAKTISGYRVVYRGERRAEWVRRRPSVGKSLYMTGDPGRALELFTGYLKLCYYARRSDGRS